ncbi:MAG: polysaccharide deacetylase family protein [Oscillospiraceae bacterium]|nr:polysaccharide deacetylase family protein [Oscillospiraceae bacterium]
MERFLIINADDFGMCRGANLAVMELLKSKDSALTSSTIMAPCAWAPEACRFAAENPELAIGVHLTLTSEWSKYRWAPVNTEHTASLRDEEGYMWHESDQVEKFTDLEEVKGEIEAQINRCKILGLTNPSHLDNHMGSLYGIETGRFELLQATLEIAGKHGLPFRFPSRFSDAQFNNTMLGINIEKELVEKLIGGMTQFAKMNGVAILDYLMPNEWNAPQTESYENFKEYLYDLYANIPEGVTETYLHPSIETDDLKGTSSVWERRVWEYNIMKDPKTKQHIEAHGIKLINYRDLAQMRK